MTNTSIVVCGKELNIGTRVVLWDEPNGLNGYDTSKYVYKTENRKTGKIETITVKGKRYGSRNLIGDISLDGLQKIVTQFFLHHSGIYNAKSTFNVLHNERRLSVHFILSDDGVIYQTLDLKEKAWHGGSNNPMSVGIEIDSRAHASKYPDAYDEAHCKKYGVLPRKKRIDYVQKTWMTGYEYNDLQYEALICLGIGLKKLFPKMGNMNFPMENGRIIKHAMSSSAAQKHCGLICHYNNSISKNDPISFDHYRLMWGISSENYCLGSSFVVADTWLDRQEWLYALGINPGPIDGDFGEKTKRAVKAFQSMAGLTADGDWGDKTEYMMDLILKERKLR
jgi:hypothetical protein